MNLTRLASAAALSGLLAAGCSFRGCSREAKDTGASPDPDGSAVLYEIRKVTPQEGSFPKAEWPFPRLTSGAPSSVLEAVNLELDSIAADFGCVAESVSTGDADTASETARFDVVPKVTLAGHGIFSMEYEASWSCPGTAHPSQGRFGATFELIQGERLVFSGLLSEDDGKAKEAREMFFEDAIAKASQEPACKELFEQNPPLESAEVKFSLAPREMRAWIEMPHAFRACDLEGNVSYEALKPYLRAGGPLEALLATIP